MKLNDRIEELEAGHIPLDARLSVSCVLEMGQLPHDLLLAVNGEPTDQAIDCRALLGPYERRIEELSRAIGVWEKIVRDKDKRIEYLEADNKALGELRESAMRLYRGATERIKELEANDLVESQLKEIQRLNDRIEAAGGDNLERNIEMLRDRGAKLTEQDKRIEAEKFDG